MSHEGEFLLWFYNQYAGYVRKKAIELCDNPQNVDDLVQTVWEKLIPKEKVLCDLDKIQQLNYICTTVRNAVREDLRRKKLTVCSLETVQWCASDQIADIDESIDREMRNCLFREVWVQVNPDIRELLERKYFLEESDEEIARGMGIKSSSVRMYLTRAKRTARKFFADHKDRFVR